MEAIVHSYETVIMLNLKLGEEGIQEMLEKFKTMITENGELGTIEDWGKRRLAYPIQDENEAYYTLINFTCGPEFLSELDRIYQITDGVLRTLIVRNDV